MRTGLMLACLLLVPPPCAGAQDRVFANGYEGDCNADTDGDRLGDCLEAALLTDLANPDTDGDGLADGDEVLGTLDGLDLPGMGALPRRKQIFVEVDWTDDNFGCVGHSHKPVPFALLGVQAMFAQAPVTNPDGSSGIDVIFDTGQGGVFDGGNPVPLVDGFMPGENAYSPEFQQIKAAHHDIRRVGRFHYALFVHAFDKKLAYTSGIADVAGNDLIVSLNCHVVPQVSAYGDAYARNTLAHELGHNLGLMHGGYSACNFKPNYNSVMNYRYQLGGLDTQCLGKAVITQVFNQSALGFSSGERLPLDETSLDEANGVCGHLGAGAFPIDWNGDGQLSPTPIVHDINAQFDLQLAACGGQYSVLQDFDDWSNVVLDAVARGDQGAPIVESEPCIPLPDPGEP